MPSDPELKRLAWRAHHRGTKEADLLIGGFFDTHHLAWGERERAIFASVMTMRSPSLPMGRDAACGWRQAAHSHSVGTTDGQAGHGRRMGTSARSMAPADACCQAGAR